MAKILTETPWDVTPTSSSAFEIYDVDDHWIAGNATDETQKYDGFSVNALDGGAPKGNISIAYKGRLMISGNNDFPSRIYFSHPGNAEGWTSTDWIDVSPEDGGRINGLDVQNDELIISKNNEKTYGWRIHDDGNPNNSRLRVIEDDKGNVSFYSGTVLEDVKYFLDRNGAFRHPAQERGGWGFIVQQVIDAVDSSFYPDVAAGAHDGRIYISLGDITLDLGDTVTITDAVLVYDTVNRAISLRDRLAARVFTRFIDSTGRENLYFGGDDGKVYKLNDGTQAGDRDIQMRIRTKPYFLSQGRETSVSKVGIYMKDPDGTVVSYRSDLNEPFRRQLGTVTKEPVQWFPVKDAHGGIFQLEFIHNNSNVRPALHGFTIVYKEQGDTEDEK